jgi:hypothetical protein
VVHIGLALIERSERIEESSRRLLDLRRHDLWCQTASTRLRHHVDVPQDFRKPPDRGVTPAYRLQNVVAQLMPDRHVPGHRRNARNKRRVLRQPARVKQFLANCSISDIRCAPNGVGKCTKP